MKIYKILFLIVVFNLFNLESYARRVREVKYPALIYKYSPLTGNIIQGDRLTEAVYPYPVIITTHPISVALCIERLIEEGGLSNDATILYLSPFHHYETGEIRRWQDSNWVRFVLENGYAQRAFSVYPPYKNQEFDITTKKLFLNMISGAKHEISLLDSIDQLPDAKDIGKVIIVFNAPYFSYRTDPRSITAGSENFIDIEDEQSGVIVKYPISLIFSVYNAINGLKNKGFEITALFYNTSPGLTYPGHAAIAQNWLLFYLEKFGL